MTPFVLLVVLASHGSPTSVAMAEFPSEVDCQRASVTVLQTAHHAAVRCIRKEATQ